MIKITCDICLPNENGGHKLIKQILHEVCVCHSCFFGARFDLNLALNANELITDANVTQIFWWYLVEIMLFA